MQPPDPDLARARDIDLQLLKLTPDDYRIYNNLACNTAVDSKDSLDYSRKAFSLMQQQHTFEPLVADTYGWSLVQSGDDRNLDEGLNVLLDAWTAKEIPDTAYHLGKAYLKKNDATEAEKYLTKAQTLFDEALTRNEVMDATLQQSIVDAQNEASKLKGRTARKSDKQLCRPVRMKDGGSYAGKTMMGARPRPQKTLLAAASDPFSV